MNAVVDDDVGLEPQDSAASPCAVRRERPVASLPVPVALPAVLIGKLVALLGRAAMVTYPGQPGTATLTAATVVDLSSVRIGSSVALAFEAGDARKPIVMGVLRDDAELPAALSTLDVRVDADGRCVSIEARDQLTLSCGDASITLTRAGKVLIRGRYVSSRSSGVLRIRGGSVQIN